MAGRLWVTLFVSAVLLCGLAVMPAIAAEADGEEEVDPRAQRIERMRELRDLIRRARAGEELTAEQQGQVDAWRERMQRAREEAEEQRRQVVRQRELRAADALQQDAIVRLNVRDQAYYRIAELQVSEEKYQEAVTTLQRLIADSEDETAVSLAHLQLGDLYRRHLANTDRAIEEYKKVTGEFIPTALARLVALYQELDRVDDAVAELEALAEATDDPLQRALALRHAAELLVQSDRNDEAIAIYQKLIHSLTHEQAESIREKLAEIDQQQAARRATDVRVIRRGDQQPQPQPAPAVRERRDRRDRGDADEPRERRGRERERPIGQQD